MIGESELLRLDEGVVDRAIERQRHAVGDVDIQKAAEIQVAVAADIAVGAVFYAVFYIVSTVSQIR